MRDVITDIDSWRENGDRIAIATVVKTWGSAPRREGAKMAFTPDGKISGSVSGGCVEGAVLEAGRDVFTQGTPQLLQFGVADETAWDVGLACGGQIEVLVQSLNSTLYSPLRDALLDNRQVAQLTVIAGPDPLLWQTGLLHETGDWVGDLDEALKEILFEPAMEDLRAAHSQRRIFTLPENRVESLRSGETPAAKDSIEVMIEVYPPPPTLVMVGGVHIAIALAAIAKTLGYQTVIVDPRKAFGSQARFSHADRLIQAWPDEALDEIDLNASTAIAMLTHDPKIDDPALMVALSSPAFYIGALGSRKTQVARRDRLRAAGMVDAQLARIHGPIGLALGAQSPEEIALAVMAQIVAARQGKLDPEGQLS